MSKNSKQKKVYFSVLMANYNNSKYIETAIRSVIEQTYPYWELIIVDDNSSDFSVEVIKKFQNHENIRLIKHNTNLGYGGSLKTAALNATKDIICICDADDKLHKEALEVLAKAYQEYPKYGLIYTNMFVCDSKLKNCIISENIGPIDNKETTIFNHKVFHLKSFRKDVYNKTKGFEISQKRSVDKDIIYKLEEVTQFKFINKPLYYYRRHQAGISQLKNQPKAFLYHYIAKCKTYRRRLDSNLPNFKKRDLYRDFFLITFRNIINYYKKLVKMFKIDILVRLIQKRYPKIPVRFKKFLNLIFNPEDL